MDMEKLQGFLTEIDRSLFEAPRKEGDPRLRERIGSDAASYERSSLVILGSPIDEGVARNQGRVGAADGPTAIRQMLYKLTVPPTGQPVSLCDLGDIRPQPSLEETHARQRELVRQVLEDGKSLIILGGGNDISFPDGAALAEVEPAVLGFNIDSHFDVRTAPKPNSGTPYRQLFDEGLFRGPFFYHLASKPECNSARHLAYLIELGAHVYDLHALRGRGIDSILGEALGLDDAKAIFWGFDLDAVRSADAPGVSAHYPVGLTAEEICRMAERAGGDSRSRILEISELNPRYDLDGRTALLAAMMVWRFVAARLTDKSTGTVDQSVAAISPVHL